MFRTLYRLLIYLMVLIAALGVWAMVDGVIQYQNRTIVDEAVRHHDVISAVRHFIA